MIQESCVEKKETIAITVAVERPTPRSSTAPIAHADFVRKASMIILTVTHVANSNVFCDRACCP